MYIHIGLTLNPRRRGCSLSHDRANNVIIVSTRGSSSGSSLTLYRSRCFVEDKRPLCPLSSVRLEDNWHNWYSTAFFYLQ